MRGLPSILSLFSNEFYKFNNTGAQMLDSVFQMVRKVSEYDQKIPQSHTADKPTTP